jgi:hypothetical protein
LIFGKKTAETTMLRHFAGPANAEHQQKTARFRTPFR